MRANEKIYDPIRKKYVAATKEEMVRQQLIQMLTNDLGYPSGLIAVERQLDYLSKKKRFDLVVYKDGLPYILAEVKAYDKSLDQNTFRQLAEYNRVLEAQFLILYNGVRKLIYQREPNSGHLTSVPDLPIF